MPIARTKAEVGGGCGQRWIFAVDKDTTAHYHGRRVGIIRDIRRPAIMGGSMYYSTNKSKSDSKGKIMTESTT
ncbi:hypothetical protein PG985_008987 [Apiospora marii]|uniref:Uncharacterized protein n=1 Tax=Apiospora marii TaxID=335849 RepID=A0ABR1RAW1_9PEZI